MSFDLHGTDFETLNPIPCIWRHNEIGSWECYYTRWNPFLLEREADK